MAEWKLFSGDVPFVSTAEFHRDRPRAPHLEQPGHRERLLGTAEVVCQVAAALQRPATFSDVGCGDGGLLSLVQDHFTSAWGYDLCPANAAGWAERGVRARLLDVFADPESAVLGDVTALTEVLEHIADPRGALAWVREHSFRLVCSSPFAEDDHDHADEHAWAWDAKGFTDLIESAGWTITSHVAVWHGGSQVVSAE